MNRYLKNISISRMPKTGKEYAEFNLHINTSMIETF
jgi:hypothetical protein